MQKFGAIFLSLGLTTPASAADYLCDSFEVAFKFYRSNVALEEFDVAGWRAQPFILRDFPVAPYIETAEEEYDLINVADATSALQGDLYLHQMNTLYQMYEILNPHPITGKFTIYNIRTEVSYVSTCERRRIIQSY